MAETDYRRLVELARQYGVPAAPPMRGVPYGVDVTGQAGGRLMNPDLANYLLDPAPRYEDRLRAAGGQMQDGQIIPPASGKVPMTADPRAGATMLDAAMAASNFIPGGLGAKGALAMAAAPGKEMTRLLPSMFVKMNDAKEFRNIVKAFRETHPSGQALDVEPLDKYKQAQLWTTPDKTAGFAVDPNGNVHSVFKTEDSPYTGAAGAVLQKANEVGGNRLDVYDTALLNQYAKQGYQEAARVPFKEAGVKGPWDPNAPGFAEAAGKTPTLPARTKDIEVGGPGYPDIVSMVRQASGEPITTPPVVVHSYPDLKTVADLTLQGRAPTVFVPSATRAFSPGIYKDPRVVVQEALARVGQTAPEHQQLWNITPEQMYYAQRQREATQGLGTLPPPTEMPKNPKGSEAAERIMTPENTQRLVDVLSEAQKHPQLLHGPYAWYFQDPNFQQMVKIVGFDRAVRDYPSLNAMMAFSSPGTSPINEINRGTAAWQALNEGWFPEYVQWGSKAKSRLADMPPDVARRLQDVAPAMQHPSQVMPMQEFLAGREAENYQGPGSYRTIKTGPYAMGSLVPETGYSMVYPAFDAHNMKNMGMADVRQARTSPQLGGSISPAEFAQLFPWYRDKVAGAVDMSPLGASGVQWTVFGPQTGVKAQLGKSKLELMTDRILERQRELAARGINKRIEDIRDQMYPGKEHWGLVPLAGAPVAGAAYMDQFAAPEVTGF